MLKRHGLLDPDAEAASLRPLTRLAIAASILAVIGGVYWFFWQPHPKPIASEAPTAGNFRPPPLPIVATLIWTSRTSVENNGEGQTDSISLGDMPEDKFLDAGYITIVRRNNEFLIHPLFDTSVRYTKPTEYIFKVEGRNNVQLVLSDDVSAQASPGSTAEFTIPPPGTPITERRMFCTGQFLFNVEHNPHIPFFVKTTRQETRVLGTLFKIRDFHREDSGAVFCYTGKVAVNDHSESTRTLVASQRLTVHANNHIDVATGDFPEVNWIAPELLFDFTDMNLDTALRQISQWYGISRVQVRDSIDKTTRGTVYKGRLSRYLTLHQLLGLLDRPNQHFTIQDRTILVTK